MLLLLLFFFEWFVFLLLDCVCRLVVNCRRLRKSTDDESKGRVFWRSKNGDTWCIMATVALKNRNEVDVKILIGSEQDGGEAKMVWACAEEGKWIHWVKNAEYGPQRKFMDRRRGWGRWLATKEDVSGISEWLLFKEMYTSYVDVLLVLSLGSSAGVHLKWHKLIHTNVSEVFLWLQAFHMDGCICI